MRCNVIFLPTDLSKQLKMQGWIPCFLMSAFHLNKCSPLARCDHLPLVADRKTPKFNSMHNKACHDIDTWQALNSFVNQLLAMRIRVIRELGS